MPGTTSETGHLTKMTLTAYRNNNFTEKDPDAGVYETMFNPASLAVKLRVDREESQPPGSTSSEMRFKMIKPQDYVFEFVIDGVKPVNGVKKVVPDEVQQLLNVVYTYKSDEHKPNYVMIRFGSVLLKCVLKTIDITYNLFTPNGNPLRAKVNCVFTSCIDQELSELINNKNSPDLTHKRVAKDGDRLVSMAFGIYRSNDYYLDVARKNGMNNFREVKAGTVVFFPPLKKLNS